MSNATEQPRTCPQNAKKHPGLPNMPVQGHTQQTKAKIAEDNRILQETCEAQEWAAVNGLQWLATMQAEMEEVEEESLAKKAKPVKPCPHPVKKRTGNAGESKNALDNVDLPEAGTVEGVRESNDDDGKGIKKKMMQKHSKPSLKDTINNAQGSLMGCLIKTQGLHVEDKKGKSSAATSNLKFSLAGCINGWASDVVLPDAAVQPKAPSASKSCTTTSALSLVHGPPSSVLSSSHATSVSGVTTKSCGQREATHASNTPEVLVGAFGDETLDDSQECLDAIVSKTKGKWSVVKDDTRSEMDDSHEDEDARMAKDSKSDSSSGVSFHRLKSKKCKLAGTKHHATALEDSSDKNNIEIIETAPTGFVRAANTVKKSTSIGISEAVTPVKLPAKKVKTKDNNTVKPPAKKVKTEEDDNDDDSQLWLVACPDLNYKVTAQGSVFGVATQCLVEWHSKFGSMGLTIMIDFFARNKDTDLKVLGQALMDDFAFIYEDMNNIDMMQAFWSQFMLQLFASIHLHCIIGHVQVTALKTGVLAVIGICGAPAPRATSVSTLDI
ncbi:hypothetical protein EDB19DRAFT_1991678 [Suillus lakei]|nr:hypothetical protein EDB19DRAFT_1991678 [Suillus lakei]